jgi:hypothetical protein
LFLLLREQLLRDDPQSLSSILRTPPPPNVINVHDIPAFVLSLYGFGNVLKMREDIFGRVPLQAVCADPMVEYKSTKHREVAMRRRDLLKYAGATALAAPFVRVARADQGAVKVGVVGAKTGPLAPGAAATHFPPWRLWAHEINQAGGLKLKDGARKVELIEYDDRTQPPEAIKAIERLATIDKADWIVGLYSTGFNIAAVPTFTKLGYPQIAVACVTDLGEQLVKKIRASSSPTGRSRNTHRPPSMFSRN